MKNCKSTATVTNGKSGDDLFYWSVTNEYRNLSAEGADKITQAMMAIQQTVKRICASKDDAGLTVTLDATLDGVAQPPIVIAGMSWTELAQAQREVWKLGDALTTYAQKHGKDKDQQRHGRR